MRSLLVPYHHADPLPAFARGWAADETIVVARGAPGAMLPHLYRTVAERVAAHAEPMLVLSGDCTTSLATVAGLQRRGIAPGVLWLDAHGDFHTARTTRSGYLGGMALAMLTGRAGAALTGAIGLAPVAEARCLLAGARDLEPGEREALAASAIRRAAVDALDAAALPPSPWYVHLDVDVVDPSALAPLRFPVPGGPSLDAVAGALRALAARGTIAALGLACTFAATAFDLPETLEPVRALAAALA